MPERGLKDLWLACIDAATLVTSKSAGWSAQLSPEFGLAAGRTLIANAPDAVPSLATLEPSVPDPIPALAPSECR